MFPHSEVEAAWAAGFYDGEGCTHMDGPYPRLLVGQVGREALDRFRSAVGVGSVGGPYSQPGRQDHFRWSTKAWRDVRVALGVLWPYLSTPKREQAISVLRRKVAV